MVGFMGSGGKTSLQRVVAEVYAAENIPTLLTTTTRCEVWPELPALTWSALQEADPGSLPEQLYVHSGEGEPGKWAGLTAEQVDSLAARFPERIVLVEVDGAAARFFLELSKVFYQRCGVDIPTRWPWFVAKQCGVQRGLVTVEVDQKQVVSSGLTVEVHPCTPLLECAI